MKLLFPAALLLSKIHETALFKRRQNDFILVFLPHHFSIFLTNNHQQIEGNNQDNLNRVLPELMCVRMTFLYAPSNGHRSDPTSTSLCEKHITPQTAWQSTYKLGKYIATVFMQPYD